MTDYQSYLYGENNSVHTSLLAPTQAPTSTDLRDPWNKNSQYDMLNNTNSASNDFRDDSGLTQSQHINYYNNAMKLGLEQSNNTTVSSLNGLVPSDSPESENCDMDFEEYHASSQNNSLTLGLGDLQIPIDDDNFCPRATSTPRLPRENSKSRPLHSDRTTVARKPAKRKLQFESEDEEAVYYLKTKYLNQEN